MQTLKEARTSRGIKQNAVADAAGITRQTYAKYEEEPDSMTIGMAKRICEFIGCDISDIFFA